MSEQKELSKEQQIEVLKAVRIELKNDNGLYLCSLIHRQLNRKFNIMCDKFEHIKLLIPLFTLEDTIRICKKNKIKSPNSDFVWWVFQTEQFRPDYTKMRRARNNFLGSLIKEIQSNG